MADKRQSEATVTLEPVESRYSRTELIQNAKAIFGASPEVVVGALYGNNAQELTLSEVRKAIDAFLKAKPSKGRIE